MINLSRVITDPRIAQPKPFTVWRKSGSWQGGRWVQTEDSVPTQGIITPATAKDITQVPEGDRTGGELTILSLSPIYVTHSSSEKTILSLSPIYVTHSSSENFQGTSDEVEWNGERYRVFNVFPWNEFGFYHAIGIRMISK
jgi:hypothetical protein